MTERRFTPAQAAAVFTDLPASIFESSDSDTGQYQVVQRSPTYWECLDSSTGSSVYAGSSPSAAVSAALALTTLTTSTRINVVGKTGCTAEWDSVPAIPPGITGKLEINFHGCKINLSATGPRLLDPGKVADHDVFSNITIRGAVINASPLASVDTSSNKGKNSLIFGTYKNGVWTTRCNFDTILIEDILVTGIPSDSAGSPVQIRRGIDIAACQAASGEGTTNYVKNITVRNVTLMGGNYGIFIGGVNTTLGAAGGAGMNLTYDNVTIEKCYHDTGLLATAFYTSASFFVGSVAAGGRCVIKDCIGVNGGDVGVEVDNPDEALISNYRSRDPWTVGIYVTNFNTPQNGVKNQVVRVKDCRSERINCTGGGGLAWGTHNSIALGAIEVDGYTHVQTNTASALGSSAAGGEFAISCTDSSVVRRMDLDRIKVLVTGQAYATTVTTAWLRFNNLSTTTAALNIGSVDIDIAGARSANSPTIRGIQFSGLVDATIEGPVTFTEAITGLPGSNVAAIGIGDGTYTSVMVFDIARLVVRSMTNASPRAFDVYGTGTTTIEPASTIHNCDFTGLPATGTEINFRAVTNLANVIQRQNRMRVSPIQPTAPAAPATTVGYVNTAGYAVKIYMHTTTANGITAIAFSSDGGSTYPQSLTLAATDYVVILDQNDAFKPTYAGTMSLVQVPLK